MFDSELARGAPMESSTQQIALGLRARDVALLRSLVEQYQYRLVRYLIYLLGRRDGVDDLVQDTWLRVLERGSSYDGRSRFEAWLFTVARNLAIDGTRKSRESSATATATDDSSPFVLAARSEDAERLALSMQALDPACREVLVLRFQEDLSLQEISSVVGAPVSTVASRIYRALRELRVQLEGGKHAV